MAPKREPPSLFNQCIGYIANALDNLCAIHVQNPTHPEMFAAAAHLNSLPIHLQASIGEALLAKVDRQIQVLTSTQVQLLLWLRVRQLSITGSVVQSGVLNTVDASNLVYLDLKYGGCGNRASLLNQFLHSLENLTFLKCTDFCNDEMLEIIANTCGRLHCIELSACNVTDEGILRMCGLPPDLRYCINVLSNGGQLFPATICSNTLKEIKLTMTKIGPAGVALILLVLRNIELLRVPDIQMEQVFKFLQTIDHKNIQCNLKEFHSREIINEVHLKTLTELCPNLEYIQVSFVGNSEMDVPRLKQLADLTHLTKAKFGDVNIDALMWFLQVVGHRMLNLHLYTYHTKFAQEKLTISRQHIHGIARYCPHLQNFCLDGYCLGETGTSFQNLSREMEYFYTLKSLELKSVDLSEEDLKVFLLKCNEMKILKLLFHSSQVLQDSLVTALLDAGVWTNLIRIRISNSPITSKVMQRLVYECPHLQEIGCLSTWLVSKQQIAEFKETLKHQNYNIEIF